MDPKEARSAPASADGMTRPAAPVNRPLDAPTRQRLADWVDQHWSAVFALIYRLCGGDRHLAEDLTQETFLKAAERRDTFAEGTNLRAWLMRIGTNAFLDSRRRSAVARSVSMDDESETGSAAFAASMAAAAASNPAAQTAHRLETAELAERVMKTLSELPETARAVFLLRTQQELSFRDIAGIIGATEETARWHMMQARRQLLAKLGNEL